MNNKPPSLVVVVFDAARAQNFGCYGYRLHNTPFLSSLAEKAAIYKNAICSSYWTLPSFASMFTGTYVSRHGLIIDGHKLKADLTTLTEYLSDNGFDTAGFCQNAYVSNYTGLDRGFDHFEKDIPRRYSGFAKMAKNIMRPVLSGRAPAVSPQQQENDIAPEGSSDNNNRLKWLTRCFIDKGASDMNRRAVRWLKGRADQDKPFSLFLLYGETHAPYCPPLPYRTRFLRDHGPVTRPLRNINQERAPFNAGRISMSDSDIAGLRALYDGSIAYSDYCVKKLYTELDAMGLLDNTIFVVTADHGDNLGEHGLLSHVHCLYDTLVRLPLIIQWPKDIGLHGIQDYIVQNIDIFPTMVEILGKEDRLDSQLEGKSLLSERPVSNEAFAVSELIKPFGPDAIPYREMLSQYDRQLVAVRSKDFKYIWSSNDQHEFYHISDDPGEEHNLYKTSGKEKYSEECEQLASYAKPWVDRTNNLYQQLRGEIEMQKEVEIDEDIKNKLKELGYF